MNAVDVVALVRDLGFPVFVAVYMLVRVDRTIRALSEAIVDLRLVLVTINKPWDGDERRRPPGRIPWMRESGPEKG